MDDIYFSGRQSEQVDVYSDSNPQPEPPRNKGKKNKKKKHGFLKFIIRAIIAVIFVLSCFIFIFALTADYTRNNLEANRYVSESALKDSPLVSNILLLGVDAENGDSGRSDSMILVSLDFVHAKIKLTSFLRDSYVYVPCRDKKAKLNSAYAYGGAQGAVDAIEYNFGVDIDHYVKVDFDMFIQIIDKLGGIDVEVTDKEASFINRTTRHTVESGKSVHLDGAKALVYARIRKLDSDYMRTQRQRKVISAIIDKCKSAGIEELYKMVNDVFPLIETDLNAGEITLMSYRGAISLLLFKLDDLRLPTDNLMTTGYVGDEWVEKPDIDGCRKTLGDFIYRNISPEN